MCFEYQIDFIKLGSRECLELVAKEILGCPNLGCRR